MRLAFNQKDFSRNFAIRPTIFLETQSSNTRLIKRLQAVSSPIENISGFSASLWNCNKLDLFKNQNTNLPYTDQIIIKCLSHLKEETGLEFCSVDSKRLGNIEWMCFPIADKYERSKVSFNVDDGHNIKIRLLTDVFESDTDLLIRCRCWNQEEVVLDQCQNSHVDDRELIELEFNSVQKVEALMITIWIKIYGKEIWEIFYEHLSLPTEINADIGVLDSQIKLPSTWLENWKNSKLKAKIDKNEIIQQISYENVTISQVPLSPWTSANKDIWKLVDKLYPLSSGCQFFQKGWDDTDIEPGRLSFFEWLKFITNNYNFGKVLFLDPYFDATDIFEVIARAEAIQTEYVVITNTQISSEDRALKLETVCKNNPFLLRNLKFRLLDIRSKGGGDKQLFHDRYILIFDQKGQVTTGYHLSNSLQGATRNSPLLITLISNDILHSVELYVADLLQDNNDREVKTIFSYLEYQQASSPEETTTSLSAIPYNNLFFAALLNDHSLVYFDQSDLMNQLQVKGVLHQNDSFIITEEINNNINNFSKFLTQSSQDVFNKLWIAFSSFLAATSDKPHPP